MQEMTAEAIFSILESGDFAALVGIQESIYLDCKSQPYGLDTDKHKFELAKDVSAFANAEGGLIIIGIKTKKLDRSKEELIDSISRLPENIIDIPKLHSKIDSHVFPKIANLRISWHQDPSSTGVGLGSIFIPRQPESLKPFLVTNPTGAEEKVLGNLFGLFERRNSENIYRTPASIHAILRLAESLSEISYRLENIESYIKNNSEKTDKNIKHSLVDYEIDRRIEDCARAGDLLDDPLIAVAAIPCQDTSLPGLFVGRTEPVIKLLENPPRFRDVGWDLNLRRDSTPISGKMRRISNPGSSVLDLWHDGLLIFAATASEDYFSWGNRATEKNILQINPIALIECLSLFARLSREILKYSNPQANSIKFRIYIRNLERNGKNARLRSVSQVFDSVVGVTKEAPESSAVLDIQPQPIDKDELEVYFSVYSKIFEWFGIDHDKIPLTKKTEDGRFVLDRDTLIELKG